MYLEKDDKNLTNNQLVQKRHKNIVFKMAI